LSGVVRPFGDLIRRADAAVELYAPNRAPVAAHHAQRNAFGEKCRVFAGKFVTRAGGIRHKSVFDAAIAGGPQTHAHHVVAREWLIVRMLRGDDRLRLFGDERDVQVFGVDHHVRVGLFAGGATEAVVPAELRVPGVFPRDRLACRRSSAVFARSAQLR
jgi:hypothetical protein